MTQSPSENFEQEVRVPPYFEAVNEDVRLPERATDGSGGYDFFAVEMDVIKPKQMKRIDTGVKIKLPKGFVLMMANRSSNPSGKNLVLTNGVGIIDEDYYDTPYTIKFEFLNIGKKAIVIQKGDKLGQGVIIQRFLTSDDNASGKRSGGFGSTGK